MIIIPIIVYMLLGVHEAKYWSIRFGIKEFGAINIEYLIMPFIWLPFLLYKVIKNDDDDNDDDDGDSESIFTIYKKVSA